MIVTIYWRAAIMSELLSKLGPEEILILALILGVSVVGLAAILGGFWYHSRRLAVDAALKREMLQQGKSAEEIERVLQATSFPSHMTRLYAGTAIAGAKNSSNCQPGAVIDEAFLIRSMVERGHDAESIEKILRLFKSSHGMPDQQQREAQMILELLEQGQDAQDVEVIIQAARGSADRPQASV
jgi:hypothetical protein